jgi:hypothetical protein
MLTRTFKQILADLEPIDDLDSIDLYANGEKISTIPNQEGKRGSLAVYAHLVGHKEGTIDERKAIYGLELFAEHTPDAQANPGKHPNIDSLFRVLDGDYEIEVRVNYKK